MISPVEPAQPVTSFTLLVVRFNVAIYNMMNFLKKVKTQYQLKCKLNKFV